jgi:hypothetical protein
MELAQPPDQFGSGGAIDYQPLVALSRCDREVLLQAVLLKMWMTTESCYFGVIPVN